MKKYLFIAAALLALAACGKEEAVQDGAVEIRLTSSLDAQTRATHGLDTQIAENEIVYVWVDDAGTGAALHTNNSLTADGSGNLSGGETMYFPASGNGVHIYAVHGSLSGTSSFWNQSITHTVASDQQSTGTGYAASDLVYCKSADVARTRNDVLLTFSHLLSKIEVVLKQGDGSPEISGAAIVNTKLQATFTPAKANDGITVTASGSAGDIAIDCGVTSGTEVLNEAIIVPQTVASGTKLIRVNAADGGELYYTTTAAATFEAGKKYRYVITVSLTGLTVTSTVSDWDTTGVTTVEGDAHMAT